MNTVGLWFAAGWVGGTLFAVLIYWMLQHADRFFHTHMKGCTRDQDCEVHFGDCSLGLRNYD